VESGFTLIELLVVIVVLGILAATVVFALTGVTGQSAQAACNSDAKTIEIAVQAYIDSPDNATNASPASVGALVSTTFPDGKTDTYIGAAPTNQAYGVALNSQLTGLTTPLGVPATAVVISAPKAAVTAATGWVDYDNEGTTTGCAAAS